MFTNHRPLFAFAAVVLAISAVIYLQRAHRDQSPLRPDRAELPVNQAADVGQPSSPVAAIPTVALEDAVAALNLQGSVPDTPPPPLPSTAAVAAPDTIALGATKIVENRTPIPVVLSPPSDTAAPTLDQRTAEDGVVKVVSPQQPIPESREPPTAPIGVPSIDTPSVPPALVPSPVGGTAPLPSAPELAKLESKTTSCPWTFQVAVVDGRTQLEARIAGDVQFTVSCDHLEMKSPAGAVQAQGEVKVRGTNVEGTCKKLTLSWTDERVQLEGAVKLKCKQDGQDVDLSGEQLSIKLAVIETVPSPAPAE